MFGLVDDAHAAATHLAAGCGSPDSLPCRVAICVLRQQLVIIGMGMPDMGNHSEADRLEAENNFGGDGTTDAAAILAACMFGNFHLFCCGHLGYCALSHDHKRGDKLMILELAAFKNKLPDAGPVLPRPPVIPPQHAEGRRTRPRYPAAHSVCAYATTERRRHAALSICWPGASPPPHRWAKTPIGRGPRSQCKGLFPPQAAADCPSTARRRIPCTGWHELRRRRRSLREIRFSPCRSWDP